MPKPSEIFQNYIQPAPFCYKLDVCCIGHVEMSTLLASPLLYGFCLEACIYLIVKFQLSTLAVSPFFVENISELQLSALKLVTSVSILIFFSSYSFFAGLLL